MKTLRCPGRSQGLWSLVCKASSMKRRNVLSVLAAKLIKGARLLVVKDGPHCITWTHADEVNRELVNFLGEGIG